MQIIRAAFAVSILAVAAALLGVSDGQSHPALHHVIPPSYAEADQLHPPPLQQAAEGVATYQIQCNAPRQLYVISGETPVCIQPATRDMMRERGIAAERPTVTIGTIAPLTGGADRYGEDIVAAVMLAADDFNAQSGDGEWKLAVEAADGRTNFDAMAAAITGFGERDIKILIGPSLDPGGRAPLDYADSRDMLLMSCCALLPRADGAGENLFRMTPDSIHQGQALARMMIGEGYTIAVPIGRDNPWVTGILDSARNEFAAKGGSMPTGDILYDASGAYTREHIAALSGSVAELADAHGADRVAVLYIGFEETYEFIGDALSDETLGAARWFGADANTTLPGNDEILLLADPIRFTVVQPGAAEGADNSEVVSALADGLGRTPSIFALFAYDAVRIVGHAITEGGSSSSADVAAEISGLTEPYDGVSGPVRFNVAGDRDGGPYDVWKLSDGAWAMTGQYDTTTEHPVVLTPEETRWLEENRTVRVAYDPDWYPIEYVGEDGALRGTTQQYMREFERLLGVDFVPISVNSWSHALDSVRTGAADMIFQVSDTEERRGYMGFTTPHSTYRTVLATLHDGELDVGAEGFRLATIRDYSIEDWLDENRPDIEYVSARDHIDALGMLEAGDADALAGVWTVISSHAGAAGVEGLRVGGTLDRQYEITIGYAGGSPLLGSILQKTLDSIPPYVLEQMQLHPNRR